MQNKIMTLSEKKRKIGFPHVFVVMTIMMLLMTLITYVVPSGEFERAVSEAGVEVINPDQFHFIEKDNPIGFMDFFHAYLNGFVGGAEILGSLLFSGGCTGILTATGCLGAGIQKLVEASKGKELLTLAILYTCFMVHNLTGTGPGSYPFYPIAAAAIVAMGFDRLTAAATIVFGCTVGFAGGTINIFTVGVSHQIVGLPLFSGLGYRVLVTAVLFVVGLTGTLIYAVRTKRDPGKSYIADQYREQLAAQSNSCGAVADDGLSGSVEIVEFTARRKIGVILFIGLLVLQTYGCIRWGWDLAEIVSTFLIFAILLAALFRFTPNQFCTEFTKAAADTLGASLIIGLARSVTVLLNQGKILDTLVYYMGIALQGKNILFTLLLIFLFVTIFNFFVTSGSGKAVMMMPILSPLGKLLGINQQVLVLTYQLGDGLTNYLWPTGSLAACMLCGIEYGPWFRLSIKVIGAMAVAAYIMIAIAHMMNYGPF